MDREALSGVNGEIMQREQHVFADIAHERGVGAGRAFEVCNHAAFPVRLKPGHPVAQLFIFKTSTKSGPLYEGRYQNATEPTVQKEMGFA